MLNDFYLLFFTFILRNTKFHFVNVYILYVFVKAPELKKSDSESHLFVSSGLKFIYNT